MLNSPYLNPSAFREYDIRGIAQQDLTNSFSLLLGYAFAKKLLTESSAPETASDYQNKKPIVVLGQDCRLSSDRIRSHVARGLRLGGLGVIEIGTIPTPASYFACLHLKAYGSIMITGSHNPKEYNGYKMTTARGSFFGKDILALKSLMESSWEYLSKQDLNPSPTDAEKIDIREAYLHDLASHAKKPTRPLRVVLDAGNGAGSELGPKALRAMGVEVIELFCEFDGTFPNHHPDPTVPKNLKWLSEKVLETKADCGIGFDGDADRIGIVDEKGRPIYGDMLLALYARQVLKENPGATIMSEVKSSFRLYQEIQNLGGQPLMWKTGHSLIKAKMKETKAKLAGEMSGHMFFADRFHGYDDALYGSLRLVEILSSDSKPLSEHLSHFAKTCSTPELRVDCLDEKKFKLMEIFAEELKSLNLGPINTLDGARLDLDQAWGLARASNTQPVLVLRFEALSASKVTELWNFFKQALEKSAKRVEHPELHLEKLSLEIQQS